MRRRLPRSLPTAVAGALLAALAACGKPAGAPARNLLLVSIDTLRADALGCYGSTRGASPRIDAFAARGLRFEEAWSHSPKTAPSHMSLLTGLPPRVHGVDNWKTAGERRLGPEAVTLAETLAARGFATAGFTSGGNVKAWLGFDRGFDVYEDQGMRMELKLPAVRRWLEQHRDERWFLFFHTYQVHDPYFASPELVARFTDPAYDGRIVGVRDELVRRIDHGEDLAPHQKGDERVVSNFWFRADEHDPRDLAHLHDLYVAGVADMDAHLGKFLDWLEREGLLADTLVVITSDHGEEFGEHGRTKHDQLWREVLRVPLLVRLPGDRAAGRVVGAPVRHVDLVPSVLELLAVADTTDQRMGESWAGWIDDPAAEVPRPLFAEHRSTREAPLDLWTLRSGGWLLHEDRERASLHDLAADPAELVPLDDPARAAELRGAAEHQIERLEQAAARLATGAGIELDAETQDELGGLGYL